MSRFEGGEGFQARGAMPSATPADDHYGAEVHPADVDDAPDSSEEHHHGSAVATVSGAKASMRRSLACSPAFAELLH